MNAGARLLCTSDGVCVTVCLVLLCGGRYGLGGGVLLFILGSSLGGVGPVRGLRVGGGVRSRPGAARTILLSHIIRDRPPKQPLFFFTRPRLADALRCRGY